jgi:Methyltransferase domain
VPRAEPKDKGNVMRSPWPAILSGLLVWFALAGMLTAHADEVLYIQTPSSVVEAMLAIAEVGPQDYVVDLGSGDGRIVIAAATQRQARGLGIDYDHTLIAESRANAARAGVSDKVEFLHQDIFLADFRQATVVTMYLLPEVNLELRPRILFDLKPGTRVVSHDWDMGDWEPDRRLVVAAPEKTIGLRKESTVYLWMVPARIAGCWRGTLTGPGGEESVAIDVVQRFQNASATVWLRRWGLSATGRLRGDTLSLVLERSPWMPESAPLPFTLQVAAGRLEGEANDGSARYVLRATRVVE